MSERRHSRDDSEGPSTLPEAGNPGQDLATSDTVCAPAEGSGESGPRVMDSVPPEAPKRGAGTLRSRFEFDQTVAVGAEISGTPRAKLEPFGPYSRLDPLPEQGNIGLVARGYNDSFGRWELLKFLRPELCDDVELVRQFRREGRVLAQLAHPNVVQVFAAYDVGEQTCLAMEFLEGRSLAALAAEQVFHCGSEICGLLGAAQVVQGVEQHI